MTNRNHIFITPKKPVVTKKNRAYWDSNPLLSPTSEAVQAAERRGQDSWDDFRASVRLYPANRLRNYPDKKTRKKCRGKNGCGRTLKLEEFHKSKLSPDRRKYTCKYCTVAYTNRLYHEKKARENGEPRR